MGWLLGDVAGAVALALSALGLGVTLTGIRILGRERRR